MFHSNATPSPHPSRWIWEGKKKKSRGRKKFGSFRVQVFFYLPDSSGGVRGGCCVWMTQRAHQIGKKNKKGHSTKPQSPKYRSVGDFFLGFFLSRRGFFLGFFLSRRKQKNGKLWLLFKLAATDLCSFFGTRIATRLCSNWCAILYRILDRILVRIFGRFFGRFF